MIGTESFYGINVERYGYIFYQSADRVRNLCIGRLFEQENDAEELQYVFEIWQERIEDEWIDDIVLPGIDLKQRKRVYVRNEEQPCFIQYAVPPECRPYENLRFYLDFQQMKYYDAFEYMLRSRAVSRNSNCYMGRAEDDLFDLRTAKEFGEYYYERVPNLDEKEWNVYHKAERLFDEVYYSSEIKR